MKIPDDVFETRCRYCSHRMPENENIEIPDEYLFSAAWQRKRPCQVMGICTPDKIPGECLNFAPVEYFGICQSCEHTSQFREGYCTCKDGPINKRRLFVGHGGWGSDYFYDHCLSTCDRYEVHGSHVKRLLELAAMGRTPRNFDPETMKPLETETQAGIACAAWERLEAELTAERERKNRSRASAVQDGADGQVSFWDE